MARRRKRKSKKDRLGLTKQTSIYVNPELWRRFAAHVLSEYGTWRKMSEEVHKIVKEHLKTIHKR